MTANFLLTAVQGLNSANDVGDYCLSPLRSLFQGHVYQVIYTDGGEIQHVHTVAEQVDRFAYKIFTFIILLTGLPIFIGVVCKIIAAFQGSYEEYQKIAAVINHDQKKALTPLEVEETTPRSLPSVGYLAWKPRILPFTEALEKMYKNAQKAIMEHTGKSLAYVAVGEGVAHYSTFETLEPQPQLEMTLTEAAEQGRRDEMEDAHFFYVMEEGILTAVFDGHGGVDVAAFVSQEFPSRFYAALKRKDFHVHAALENVIDAIQQEIVVHYPEWDQVGSTAVISFIEKDTNYIFTATLGDSEANIYRNINGKIKSIPLSCIRDWSSVKEAHRAATKLNSPQIAQIWPKSRAVKFLRINGVNVSRAFGDMYDSRKDSVPGQIHKPKITINRVHPGDILVLACDGLKDFVEEEEIVQILDTCDRQTIATTLVSYALKKHTVLGNDNVTVLALSFHQRFV